MANRLAVNIEDREEFSLVTLSGIVDEDNHLSELPDRIKESLVVINTAHVERINSCGVRDWVTWLGEMEKRGKTIYFIECPPVIMAQVNLVYNFVGSGQIINFFGPYFCSKCDTDRLLLIDVQEALTKIPFKAPVCRCNTCDLTMEFDDIENSYFAFLGQLKNKPLDAAVVDKIKRLTATTGQALRSRSPTIPLPTTTPSSSSSASFSATLPAGRDFKSLLATPEPVEKPRPPAASNLMLYVIIGLLVLATTLLAVVALRLH
jgi:hypothetical protein